jgi:hypothetical protein
MRAREGVRETIYLCEEGGCSIYTYRRYFLSPSGLLRPHTLDETGKRCYAVRRGDTVVKSTLLHINEYPSWSSGVIINPLSVAVSLVSWDDILRISSHVPIELLEYISFTTGEEP